MRGEEEPEIREPHDPDDLVRHGEEEAETDVDETEVDGAVAEEAMRELPDGTAQRLTLPFLGLGAPTGNERHVLSYTSITIS